MNDTSEQERLAREASELRDLVRALSARLAQVTEFLPVETAVALARGGAPNGGATVTLEGWTESVETTRTDAPSELALLWQRLPPREGA